MELTADKLVNKYLHAAKSVDLYSLPDTTSTILDTVEKGQVVGKIYSFVERGGKVWWMFEFANGGFYYVPHITGNFDWDQLKKQLPSDPPQSGGTSDTLMMGGIVLGAATAFTAKQPGLRIIGGALAAFLAGKMIINKVSEIDFNPFKITGVKSEDIERFKALGKLMGKLTNTNVLDISTDGEELMFHLQKNEPHERLLKELKKKGKVEIEREGNYKFLILILN